MPWNSLPKTSITPRMNSAPDRCGARTTRDLPLPLPNTQSLEGTTFYNQAWVIDAKANAFGVGTSNGGKGVIGY